jgi:hypothetical protein
MLYKLQSAGYLLVDESIIVICIAATFALSSAEKKGRKGEEKTA